MSKEPIAGCLSRRGIEHYALEIYDRGNPSYLSLFFQFSSKKSPKKELDRSSTCITSLPNIMGCMHSYAVGSLIAVNRAKLIKPRLGAGWRALTKNMDGPGLFFSRLNPKHSASFGSKVS